MAANAIAKLEDHRDKQKRAASVASQSAEADATEGTAGEQNCKPSANGRWDANRAPRNGIEVIRKFGRSERI